MSAKQKEAKLEKQLSPVNVWALALGCIIGWGAFVMPGNTFLGKAGPLGTLIAMSVAAVIMIVIAFNYNYMINKFPVAGGEFTYTQQAFGEKNAFVCSALYVSCCSGRLSDNGNAETPPRYRSS